MAIAGSMGTWRNRMAGATDVELVTLDREMEQDNPLRPILSDEILRRATQLGTAVAETPTMATTSPAAPNVPAPIPTAPAALMSVPDAPPPPGGRGAPPADPITLANRAQKAIEGGDQDTAIQIYDFGLETHGQAFVSAFDALDREAPARKSGLPRTEGGRGGILGHGGLPRSAAGRDDQEINPPGVPAVLPPGSVPMPDPPPVTPLSKDGPLPVVRPDPLIKVGDAAGLPPDPTGTGYRMTLNGLPRAGGDKGGVLGYGGLPRGAAGRDDQEINPPGVPVPASTANLDRSLEDVSQSSIAPIAPGPVDRTVTSEALPVATGLRSVPTTRGPMTTAAGTSEGRMFYDRPVTSQGPYGDEGTDRPRRRKDGSYYDPPVGPQVIAIEDYYEPPNGRALPRNGTKLAAAPGSGGLATTVTVPMRPEPKPVVDTGTNAPAPSASPAAPAVDTNTPAADDSGFMSKPDIWSFLTSAGLGMMSSQSPDFLGAVGAGGTAGINQLGVLRKDQRERAKNLADAQFQKDRIALGYSDQASQERRTDRTLTSQERIADKQIQAGDQRLDKTISADRENLGTRLAHDASQTERQAQLNRMLYAHQEELKREGKDLDRRGIYDFTIEKGGTPDEARDAALGYSPTKPDKPTPMSEKDVTLTHDMVANKLFGAGVPGSTLLQTLPPDISIEYQRAVGSKQDAASAYAAGMEVLKKYGITEGKKDGSWWPGDQPELRVPKTTRALPGAGGGGGGGGGYVWDDEKRMVVPK